MSLLLELASREISNQPAGRATYYMYQRNFRQGSLLLDYCLKRSPCMMDSGVRIQWTVREWEQIWQIVDARLRESWILTVSGHRGGDSTTQSAPSIFDPTPYKDRGAIPREHDAQGRRNIAKG